MYRSSNSYRWSNPGRAIWWLVLCLWLVSPARAGADRVDRLIRMLKPDPDYKVRLQIIQVMGKLKSRRSVPSLIRALDDPTPVVRGMAVLALWRIGDLSAIRPLRQRLSRETDPNVKHRLRRVLKEMEPLLSRPPAGVRYFISLGTLQNRTSIPSVDITRVMEDSLQREFRAAPHITTRWGAGRPTRQTLKKHGMKGYVLDATVTTAGARPQGNKMMLFVLVKYALTPMFGSRARVTFPGNAKHPVPLAHYQKRYLVPYITDLMEVSAKVARENIGRHYLPRK